jgi:hypothetical protein
MRDATRHVLEYAFVGAGIAAALILIYAVGTFLLG